jgi:hypothetical protein
VTQDDAIRAFAVSMALQLNVPTERAERMIRKLLAHGFIECVSTGPGDDHFTVGLPAPRGE